MFFLQPLLSAVGDVQISPPGKIVAYPGSQIAINCSVDKLINKFGVMWRTPSNMVIVNDLDSTSTIYAQSRIKSTWITNTVLQLFITEVRPYDLGYYVCATRESGKDTVFLYIQRTLTLTLSNGFLSSFLYSADFLTQNRVAVNDCVWKTLWTIGSCSQIGWVN